MAVELNVKLIHTNRNRKIEITKAKFRWRFKI